MYNVCEMARWKQHALLIQFGGQCSNGAYRKLMNEELEINYIQVSW